MYAKAELVRLLPIELVEDRHGLLILVGIHIGARQIVAQLAGGGLDRGRGILGQRFDIAESDQLIHRLLGRQWVEALFFGEPGIVTGDIVPTGDGGDLGWLFEGIQQYPSVHVFAHRQPKQRQYGRGDVQQPCAVDVGVLADAGAGHQQHAKVAVLDGGAGRLVGQLGWSQMVRVEAVVRADDDGGICRGQRQHRAKHHVVEAVAGLDHTFIALKIVFRNVRATGRVVLHEAVAKVINGVVIDPHEVPWLMLHRPGGRRVHRAAFGQDLHYRGEAFVLFLINLFRVRNKRDELLRYQLVGVQPQLGECLCQLRRVDRAGTHIPGLPQRAGGGLVVIGDHHTIDWLNRVAGPPADYVGAQPLLVEDVPDGLGGARQLGHRLHRGTVRGGLGEAEYAVLEWSLAGGNRGPQHG